MGSFLTLGSVFFMSQVMEYSFFCLHRVAAVLAGDQMFADLRRDGKIAAAVDFDKLITTRGERL